MEINYKLTPKDFFEFGKENAPNQKTHQPMVIILLITYLFFIFTDVIYALLSGSLEDWKFAQLFFNIGVRTIITFSSIIIISAVIKFTASKKAQVLLKNSTNGLFCEHRIILTEKELIEITDINISRYSWKAIGEIKELENFVLINITLSSSYIIPKKYFQNREEIKRFFETADFYQRNADNSFQPSHFIEYEKSLS